MLYNRTNRIRHCQDTSAANRKQDHHNAGCGKYLSIRRAADGCDCTSINLMKMVHRKLSCQTYVADQDEQFHTFTMLCCTFAPKAGPVQPQTLARETCGGDKSIHAVIEVPLADTASHGDSQSGDQWCFHRCCTCNRSGD